MAALYHVKPKTQWKRVEIPNNLSCGTDFDDLIEIQELADYELIRESSGAKKMAVVASVDTKNSKKKKKRKHKNIRDMVGKEKMEFTEDCIKTETSIIRDNFFEAHHEQKLHFKNSKQHQACQHESTETKLSHRKTNKKKPQKRKREPDICSKMLSDTIPSKKQRKCVEEQMKETDLKSEMSDLQDMKAWSNLFVPPVVLLALKRQGFMAPTPIQALTLPHAIRDKLDIIGAAETGSGKTLAFSIPVLHHILQRQEEIHSSVNDIATVLEDEEQNIVVEQIGDEIESSNEDEERTEETTDDNREYDLEPGSDDGIVDEVPDFSKVLKVKAVRKSAGPLALILEPTRELALQVKKHIVAAAEGTGIKVVTVVGGMAIQKQLRLLKRKPEIVIATPGRLWELMEQGEDHLKNLHMVEQLIVDEADRMVEKGHFEELTKILAHINSDELIRRKRQTFVFSATLTMIHAGPYRHLKKKKKVNKDAKQKLEELVERIGIKDKPKVIDLTRKEAIVHTLTEARIICRSDEKDLYLYYLLRQYGGRTLVFCNSKDCIRRLVSIFTLLGRDPLPLHADMHQRQRLKNLDRFSERTTSLLLASDVAARGLDIPNVDHVIHYQVPRTIENYVHRSGRTARASKEGLSVVLVSPDDVQNYRKIINNIKQGEDLPLFPLENDVLHHLKRHISLACEIDKKEHKFMKEKRHNNWVLKAAEEMDIDVDEEQLLVDIGDNKRQQEQRLALKHLRNQLALLMKQPVIPSSFSSRYPTKSGHLVVPTQGQHTNAITEIKQKSKKR